MRIRSTAALAASVLSFVPSAPAHAAPPTVGSQFTTTTHQQEGSGRLVVVGCRALATQGGNFQVPLLTEVTCSVNDTVRTVMAPGAVAATQLVLVVPPGPVIACHSGESLVMDQEPDANAMYHVTTGPTCMRLPGT